MIGTRTTYAYALKLYFFYFWYLTKKSVKIATFFESRQIHKVQCSVASEMTLVKEREEIC